MDITLEEAKPTAAHMAMAELVRRGVCQYVVSTNVDGLHRRSSIPPDKISELHGPPSPPPLPILLSTAQRTLLFLIEVLKGTVTLKTARRFVWVNPKPYHPEGRHFNLTRTKKKSATKNTCARSTWAIKLTATCTRLIPTPLAGSARNPAVTAI
eukprot:TRINITY_DN1266_c1_g1_i2.p1 TRINITY_DN1266_c1_g1~~TRINITY_DN1266_c1_g1_i2.p1  ORF type:complete len:154 (-),score=21.39 TRINITY_DN1266_c1_g1_i2:318-779(-)